jgi:hypothetical protein
VLSIFLTFELREELFKRGDKIAFLLFLFPLYVTATVCVIVGPTPQGRVASIALYVSFLLFNMMMIKTLFHVFHVVPIPSPMKDDVVKHLTSLGFLDNNGFSTRKGQLKITTQTLSRLMKKYALQNHPDKTLHLQLQQRKQRQQKLKGYNNLIGRLTQFIDENGGTLTLHPKINYTKVDPPTPWSSYTRRA